MKSKNADTNPRREFLGKMAGGIAAVGFSSFIPPLSGYAEKNTPELAGHPDDLFKQLKGKHRIVFDVPEPNDILPFAWPRVFLVTNEATGSSEKDCNAVVILRHSAIPYALEDRLWEKYKLGEVFKINDPKTGKPATRNPFWKPQKGDFKIPGLGEVPIGINELQDSGVMFCVCSIAMIVNSSTIAASLKLDAAEVKKDWDSGLLPGMNVVPSGVWAVNRAQENGCSYCFAG